MTDRTKVIQAMENCPDCSKCYTGGPGFGIACRDQLRRDVLALLKEQGIENSRIANEYQNLKKVASKQRKIVRCNDCKYWDSEEHICNIKVGRFACGADWFCADGKRR